MTYSDFLASGFLGRIEYSVDTPVWIPMVILGAALLVAAAVGYFLGSLNFGVILSSKLYHDDIRQHGSGNAGMTNMLRTYGLKAAALTLLGDAGKAVISVFVGFALYGRLAACIAGLFCIVGHIFPIYYQFKGGKGVVTSIVMILSLYPLVGLILLVIFALIVLGTKYISLGSVMCALIYPLILSRVYQPNIIELVCAFLVLGLVVFMHRSNIKRLQQGKENKISIGGKKQSEDKNEQK